MAVIRVPQEAKPLLPLCRKHDLAPGEERLTPCFDTYADLIVFAAAYGFAEMNGRPPVRKKMEFLERPNPIDLGIFKSENRYPQILLIALGTSKDQNVVRDEELICRLIEDFAAVGLQRLHGGVAVKSHAAPHLALSEIIISAVDQRGKI
jgi:dnd system-associated protein 4